ncbi:hypothetical protein K458DRAFT_443276 [Lentithecium fluviatile CBS 122367]|uniref:Stc1 domain-containing protein n=1 Tax=Lentithecium fluviatile CBS 122367 TaxID=1168545 RepID=A0A6G1IZM9_9PLEO|nr:hypothetical protein K458DRAFT_443276 [Lentithecium fluviatile CBS 122367]
MDFSNNAFGDRPATALSDDTINHANMVQACRFGWAAGPPNGTSTSMPLAQAPAPMRVTPMKWSNDNRAKRLTPCRGRLYHQLICSHRIRTDYVDDCGSNCLEPFGMASKTPFYCQECVDIEAAKIREARETEHSALYPSMDQMTKEQYEAWYDERCGLETQFTRDRKIYQAEMKTKTRPSNVCSALEMSEEEKNFASELDSLSLMMSSTDSTTDQLQPQPRYRVSLPTDTSEQLHWGLNSLAIDRGSCSVEYTTGQPPQNSRAMSDEELWQRPRDRD